MKLPETFTRSLVRLGESPGSARTVLKNPALSIPERKILEAHLLIRANRNLDAILFLKAISPGLHPFVEAERLLMLGVALLNLSRFKESGAALKMAAKRLDRLDAGSFRFTAWFNLFLCFFNSGNRPGMARAIRVLTGIAGLSEWSRVRLLRVRFLHAVETGDRKGALGLLPLIRAGISKLPESDRISQEVSEFRFHILCGEFEAARKTLLGMKRHRKFHLKQNFNFMKILLDHLTEGKPVYAYFKDFKEAPLLFAQLRVIQSLESGDRESALRAWSELSLLVPEIHGAPFETFGPETLFSLCVRKNLKRPLAEEVETDGLVDNLQQKLVRILRFSEAPVQKSELFERIWGRPLQDKEDLRRLSRLVSKARKAFSILIQSRRGAYFIS